MTLQIPETRQAELAARAARGDALALADLADEFGVSVDTVRRDLDALEVAGRVRRVRGGAVPVAAPAPPLRKRAPGLPTATVAAALDRIAAADTVLFDGGTSVAQVAAAWPVRTGRLLVTPAPALAAAAHGAGHAVHLLGGRVSEAGGIACGEEVEAALGDLAVDVALLGACGLDGDWGLSSDDMAEARVKAAMARAAARVVVVTGSAKVGRRARHRTLGWAEIDALVTDGAVPPDWPVEVVHG